MKVDLHNELEGIKHNSVMFNAAKEALNEGYDKATMIDAIHYMVNNHYVENALSIITKLCEESIFDVEYVTIYCNILEKHFPYKNWLDYRDRMKNVLLKSGKYLEHHNLELLANTFEILYAKGIDKDEDILALIYDFLQPNTSPLESLTERDVRIKAARIAYRCNEYNAKQSINEINNLITSIKKQGIKGVKRIANYYLGLCERYILKNLGGSHIEKSKNKEFYLAITYIENICNH